MNVNSYQSFTTIKTGKSVKRFEKAITNTFLTLLNHKVEALTKSILNKEAISRDSLIYLLWVGSLNNELINYLNQQVFFAAFYSGRITLKSDEVLACLKELKGNEVELKKWSDSTLKTSASKYLTLLKKFNLMDGSVNKKIIHPYLSDKMFVLFVYFLVAVESSSNLLESQWLKYCFLEQQSFIERVLQKKYSRFYELVFTGDKLKIETSFSYEKIYNAIK